MEYSVNIHKDFQNELVSIYQYIAFNLKEPKIAHNLIHEIIQKVSSLSYFPERFPKISNYKNLNIRKLCFNNFVIIYEVNQFSKSVFVLHLFHR